MLKTNIKVTFKDGEELEIKNVIYALLDLEKMFETEKENVMIVRFVDDEKGEGSVVIEKESILFMHVELLEQMDRTKS